MQKQLRSLVGGLALALILAWIAPGARADNITFTYTGNSFNYIQGFVCPQQGFCGITGSVTLSAPLAANLSGGLLNDIVAFSFSNGVNTFNLSNTGSGPPYFIGDDFSFWTDNSANITGWRVQLTNPVGYIESWGGVGATYSKDETAVSGYDQYGDWTNLVADRYYQQGTWTESGEVSTTPEPASWALMGGGTLTLLAMAWAAERRRRAAACFEPAS